MAKRIVAIIFILICSSVAWIILGGTITWRTEASKQELTGRVASIWGSPQEQDPPSASYRQEITRQDKSIENGKTIIKMVPDTKVIPLPLESTNADVALDLHYRQKGLLWYSTYMVGFRAVYGFRNTSPNDEDITFTLPFPAAQAVYDDVSLRLDGTPLALTNKQTSALGTARIAAGKTVSLEVVYRSQGLTSWRYRFGSEVAQVRNFQMRMKTNFKQIDFPDNTLSPTNKIETADGWELAWNYKNLVSGYHIAMLMPEALQPGPLAGQISFFAPLSLFFFFFVLVVITTLRGIDLHPMNYFFLAAAYFAFHLLLAYLADHISIHAAFLIASAVSIFLVVSYLRLVVGIRFAAMEAGGAQFVYLVLFSYAFFFKGYTGLAVTIGSILTLFVVMQLTGRINWAERFSRVAEASRLPESPRGRFI